MASEAFHPVHRALIAIDIEGSTSRTNPAKVQLRHALYEVLQAALEALTLRMPRTTPSIVATVFWS
jgi:hypothetical protein